MDLGLPTVLYIYIDTHPLFYLYFKNTHKILNHLSNQVLSVKKKSYQVLTYLHLGLFFIILLNTLVNIVELISKN